MFSNIKQKVQKNVEIKSLFSTFIGISINLFCFKFNVNNFGDQLEYYIYSITLISFLRIFLIAILSNKTNDFIKEEFNFKDHEYKLDTIHELYIFLVLVLVILIPIINTSFYTEIFKYLILLLTQIFISMVTFIEASRKYVIDNSKFHKYKLLGVLITSLFSLLFTFQLKMGFFGVVLSQLISAIVGCFFYQIYPFY